MTRAPDFRLYPSNALDLLAAHLAGGVDAQRWTPALEGLAAADAELSAQARETAAAFAAEP